MTDNGGYQRRGPRARAFDRFMWWVVGGIIVVGGIASYFIMTTGTLPFLKD